MQNMYLLKCESHSYPSPITRRVTVFAEDGDEAEKIFRSSHVAPFPQMRAKGFVPIAVTAVV